MVSVWDESLIEKPLNIVKQAPAKDKHGYVGCSFGHLRRCY